MSRIWQSRHGAGLRWSMALAFTIGVCSSAVAELAVRGEVGAIHVEVRQAPVSEILSRLGTAYQLRYRSAVALNSEVSGTYAGPLADVLSGVLRGYNYVIRREDGTVEVLVIGRRGERTVAAERLPPVAAPARNTATFWRTPPDKAVLPRP